MGQLTYDPNAQVSCNHYLSNYYWDKNMFVYFYASTMYVFWFSDVLYLCYSAFKCPLLMCFALLKYLLPQLERPSYAPGGYMSREKSTIVGYKPITGYLF